MTYYILIAILLMVIGYFMGCISTGVLVGKYRHTDIRKEGSGNIGTTNALRTMGKLPALLTFAGDVFKAVIPIVIVRLLFRAEPETGYLMSIIMGLGVVLGHNFPFWLGFKGGKGIAVTSAVVLSVADYRVILVGLALFILVVALTRYVSLGSLVVAWYLPVNTVLFHRTDKLFILMLIISLCFTLLAYIRHHTNIVSLLHGTERKLGEKKEG